jgi:hypothetical protein
MVWQVPISVSLSTLPIVLDVQTVSCGVKPEGLAKEHPEPEDILSKPLLIVIPSRFYLCCVLLRSSSHPKCDKQWKFSRTSCRFNVYSLL